MVKAPVAPARRRARPKRRTGRDLKGACVVHDHVGDRNCLGDRALILGIGSRARARSAESELVRRQPTVKETASSCIGRGPPTWKYKCAFTFARPSATLLVAPGGVRDVSRRARRVPGPRRCKSRLRGRAWFGRSFSLGGGLGRMRGLGH